MTMTVLDLRVRTVLLAPTVIGDLLQDNPTAQVAVRTLVEGVRSGHIASTSWLLDLTVAEAAAELGMKVREVRRVERANLPAVWPPLAAPGR
jgi:hypothetical protein